MISTLKLPQIRKLFPQRAADSHKGMNGRVLIVGGSIDFHGAPILCGLGALYSGTDLVYLAVPESNFDVTRSQYADFIVRPFEGQYLTSKSVEKILELAQKCDAVLIGPGLGESEETMAAIHELVLKLPVPTLLDASAIQVLQKIKKFPLAQPIVITPHHHEFASLISKDITIQTSDTTKIPLLKALATDLNITILLKGPTDYITSEKGEMFLNTTGNAGMTVGGSGDVLGGFVVGLMAKGVDSFQACQIAAYLFGKTGEALARQKGYAFSASDLAMELPYVIRESLS